jgi:hypothetical protein
MLLLVSQNHALQHACDLALTALVFGQDVQLVLWPDVLASLTANPPLCSQLEEFGIARLYTIDSNTATTKATGIEVIALNDSALQTLIASEKKALSF